MTTNSRAIKSNGGMIALLADVALKRFRIVVEGSDARHAKYPAAVTDVPKGVTVDGGAAAEDAVAIGLLGRGETKVLTLNGTCIKGQWLTPEDPATDATGKVRAVPATAGAFYVIGKALEDGADEQDIAAECCLPFLAGAQHANGQLSVPSFATDPTTPSASQLWVNSADNSLNVWINGAKRTITFALALVVLFLASAMLMAADKTPMVLGNATTGQIAAATGADNILVPGTLEVTGAIAGGLYVSRISEAVAVGDFTDGEGTSGYIDLTDKLPAGSLVLGWRAEVTGAFTGDTHAYVTIGKAGATTAYSTTTTANAFGAGTIGSATVLATAFEGAETTVRVTVTGNADFTSIKTADSGAMTVTVFYAQ